MDLNRLNWNDLRIFLTVARSKTLSSAAKQLAIDDSTVSRRITHLEYHLNSALLERDYQGIHLTPQGEQLLQHVEDMERAALSLIESVSHAVSEPHGRVRVASMEGIATLYLAGQFATLKTRHPSLHIELVTSSTMIHVNRREADIFLSFFPLEARGLDALPIGEFSLYLYASESYLKNKGHPKSKEDLTNHDFVSYINDLIQLDTVRWLDEAISEPKIVFCSTSMLSQMYAAAAGMGIVMLPNFAHAESLGLIRLLENELLVSRTLWMSVHQDLRYTRRIKTTMSFLYEIFKQDYPCPPSIIMKEL